MINIKDGFTNDLLEFFVEVQKRPALYLGEQSLSKLIAFIHGWEFGSERIHNLELLSEFDRWIKDKYNFNQNLALNYIKVIELYSSGDHQAFEHFFEQFNLFLKDREMSE